MNAKYLDLDDWTLHHQRIAAAQGWQLTNNGQLGNHSIEIRCLGNQIDLIRIADRSENILSDEDAVAAMKSAYMRKEDHAVLAYNILKYQSHLEFKVWGMGSWPLQRKAA